MTNWEKHRSCSVSSGQVCRRERPPLWVVLRVPRVADKLFQLVSDATDQNSPPFLVQTEHYECECWWIEYYILPLKAIDREPKDCNQLMFQPENVPFFPSNLLCWMNETYNNRSSFWNMSNVLITNCFDLQIHFIDDIIIMYLWQLYNCG